MLRIIILGNSGSGKSTMARRLSDEHTVPMLELDAIAWQSAAIRKPLAASIDELLAFVQSNEQWVIEGCYADLMEPALPFCTELRFLNPGIEACIENCRKRPWEPAKFATPDAQQAMRDQLIDWVRQYEIRNDEFGLRRHRSLFDTFAGAKIEYRSLNTYDTGSY